MKATDSTINSDEDEEWITVNSARVKVENGELQGEVGEKIVEAPDKLSSTGANPTIPDMMPEAQQRHKKHLRKGKSYSGMPMTEYVEKASELARSPIGGDIDGYKATDGAVVRYNKNTNDFVKGYSTGVATMFKPSSGEDYFKRKRSEEEEG